MTKHDTTTITCGYCRERFALSPVASLAAAAGRPAATRCPWCMSVIVVPQAEPQRAAA